MQERIKELLRHINTQPANMEGEQGKWLKAVEHSHWYDREFPDNPDKNNKGFLWNREILDFSHSDGRILIYQDRSRRNWFVLKEFAEEFEREHNAELL